MSWNHSSRASQGRSSCRGSAIWTCLPNGWGPNCHKICCLRTYLHSYQTAVSPVGFHQMFSQLPGRAWIFRRLSKPKTRGSCDACDASPICRLHYCVFSLQKLRNNNFILRQDKPYALLNTLPSLFTPQRLSWA